MSWSLVRIPWCGPLDEDTARPFVAVGSAVPVAVGYQWRKGAIRPWRDAEASSSGVTVESRRFGSLVLQPRPLLDAAHEIIRLGTESYQTSVPACVARVIEQHPALREYTIDGNYDRFDACVTENWIVAAYFGQEDIRITATHRRSGHVLETHVDYVNTGTTFLWAYPRVLRDNTGEDRFIISYVRTDQVNPMALSTAKWSFTAYSVSVVNGFAVLHSSTEEITIATTVEGNLREPRHDARELGGDYTVFVGVTNDPAWPPSPRQIRMVMVDSAYSKHTGMAISYIGGPYAVGAFHTAGGTYIAIMWGDSTETIVDQYLYDYSMQTYSQQTSLPYPISWICASGKASIGGHVDGGWRIVTGEGRWYGCTHGMSPATTHRAHWEHRYHETAVPYYVRGIWHYLLRFGQHYIVAAEYGSGIEHVTETGAVNTWRMLPVVRIATWLATTDTIMVRGILPRYVPGESYQVMLYCPVQVTSGHDADAYVIDHAAGTEAWSQDIVLAAGAQVTCTGLLAVPDLDLAEEGFVAAPEILSTTVVGATQRSVVVQLERRGRSGEIHRSSPSPASTFHSDDTYNLEVAAYVSRDLGQTALIVWEADSAGVFRERKRVTLSPYDSSTTVFVGTGGSEPEGAVAPWYGQLGHGPPPSPWHAAVHGQRTWVISAEYRDSLWPSLLMTDPLVAPLFSASLAMVAHDDKLHRVYSTDVGVVALGERGVYVVRGDGPDNTGAGGAFELHRIPGAAGCSGVACQTRWGIVYTTTDGVMLLDRGLSVARISDQIRGTAAASTIRDAVWWPARDRVVLSTASDELLLWSLERGWSVVPCAGAAALRVDDFGRLEVVNTDGKEVVYDPVEGNADAMQLKVSTAWLDAVVQPWVRIRKVRVRGRILSGQVDSGAYIRLKIYADGNDASAAQTHSVRVDELEVWGEARSYTLRLAQQRYETIRVELIAPAQVPIEWEWVEFEFLAKRGTKRGSHIVAA